MSSGGSCPKELLFEKLGYPVEAASKWLTDSAEEGKWHEKRIKDELRAKGVFVKEELECSICLSCGLPDRNGNHLEYTEDNFMLVGHTDGELMFSDCEDEIPTLLEVKSKSSKEFFRWKKEGFGGHSHHASQIASYMMVGHFEECLYIIKNRDIGAKIEFTLTLKQDPWIKDEFENVLSNIRLVESILKENKPMNEVPFFYSPENPDCGFCSFKKLCIEKVSDEFPGLPESILKSAVEDYRKGFLLEKEGSDLMYKSKAIFKDQLDLTQKRKLETSNLVYSQVNVKGKKSYPLNNLLEFFSIQQLDRAAKYSEPYSFIRVDDDGDQNK